VTTFNSVCDGCGRIFTTAGYVRRLRLPEKAGVFLCRQCWEKEMQYRKEMNTILPKGYKWPIRKWPGK